MIETGTLARLYWDVFFLAFIGIALWESFRPRRPNTRPTARRWGQNGALAALTSGTVLLIRASPVMVAVAVANSPYGLLNRPSLALPLQIAATVLALDFVRYVQHRLMHSVGPLWRLHQVHHSDEHVDLTTGLRLHPAEAVVTYTSYLGAIALLAPPVEAVLLMELATLVQNFFAHANIHIPDRYERPLRRLLITAEMHRVHHSVCIEEQNTNFGSILPFWDRLFGTYLAGPVAGGRDALRFGLKELESSAPLPMTALLKMPFAAPARPRTRPGVGSPLG